MEEVIINAAGLGRAAIQASSASRGDTDAGSLPTRAGPPTVKDAQPVGCIGKGEYLGEFVVLCSAAAHSCNRYSKSPWTLFSSPQSLPPKTWTPENMVL